MGENGRVLVGRTGDRHAAPFFASCSVRPLSKRLANRRAICAFHSRLQLGPHHGPMGSSYPCWASGVLGAARRAMFLRGRSRGRSFTSCSRFRLRSSFLAAAGGMVFGAPLVAAASLCELIGKCPSALFLRLGLPPGWYFWLEIQWAVVVLSRRRRAAKYRAISRGSTSRAIRAVPVKRASESPMLAGRRVDGRDGPAEESVGRSSETNQRLFQRRSEGFGEWEIGPQGHAWRDGWH